MQSFLVEDPNDRSNRSRVQLKCRTGLVIVKEARFRNLGAKD